MRITIRDIHKRLKLLPESTSVGKLYRHYINKADEVIQSNNPSKIMKMLEIGINDDTNSMQFSTIIELFDALIECGNSANVKQYGNMINEKYIAKVRDAKEAQTNLKRKLGRMKSNYTTKIQNNYEDISDVIYSKIHAAQNNLKSNINKIKSNVSNGLPNKHSKKSEDDIAKQEAVIHIYENMINECTKIIYCDRILENYNRISKRFNIDRIIQENIYNNGIDDTIGEICRLIETYDVPDKVKFNTALESTWYGFRKNYVDCSDSLIVTTISDYYLAKGNNREMCSKLLEASMIVKRDDYKGDLEVIQEEEPEEENKNIDENAIQDSIRSYVVGNDRISSIRLNEATSFNKTFEQFRSSNEEKKENKLQFLIRKLYTKSADDIIQGTPSLFNYIRIVFILGTVAINPVLGAVSAIADVFISLHKKREETEKMIKCFEKEIEATNKKIKSTTNAEEKNRLTQYKKELVKGKEKIEEYYEEMLTDKEIDAKYDDDSTESDSFKSIANDIKGEDDDFDDFDDFGDDDFDFDDFNEAAKMIPVMQKLVEDFVSLPLQIVENEDLDEIIKMAPSLTQDLANISIWRPDIIDPDMMKEIINNRILDIRKNTIANESTGVTKFTRLNMLNECLYNLSNTTTKHINDKRKDIFECAFNLSIMNETLSAIYSVKNACDYYHPLIEGSFTNSITLASEKLKKTIQKMSDKEKQISKNIDVAANNTKKAVEKSLTTDNREAVIKGSILPSASKTIKLAITGAGLCLIDPVIAVIGVLGYIGVNKKYKAKERQMVIDEIEIEMKMCEKYIDIAESKNDMKALKQLLTIQRELERQHQRLKYKMRVDFGQKYYDAKTSPTNYTSAEQ